jgi:hypothetical protein
MRLLSAYEDELQRDWDAGQCFVWTRDRVPEMARKMIKAASVRQALIPKNSALARAAIACGIKPTERDIQAYIVAAGFDQINPF